MHVIKKSVFYCDFCRKYKLTSHAMKLHEERCTMNPDRVCRMPGCKGDCPLCSAIEIEERYCG